MKYEKEHRNLFLRRRYHNDFISDCISMRCFRFGVFSERNAAKAGEISAAGKGLTDRFTLHRRCIAYPGISGHLFARRFRGISQCIFLHGTVCPFGMAAVRAAQKSILPPC